MEAILALDTATNACSVAVAIDGVILASRYEEMVQGHAERLVPMVAEITDEAGCPVKAIDLVAVTVGPGAFTGIRVGLAAARGFALSAEVPCLGFTTLEVIAASMSPASGCILVALDSKREDIYFQIFSSDGEPCTEAATALPEQIVVIATEYITDGANIILAGDAALAISGYFADVGINTEISRTQYPRALDLARIASLRRPAEGRAKHATPMYMRLPDAILPVSGGRLRP